MPFPHGDFLYEFNHPDQQRIDQVAKLRSYLSQEIRCPISDVQLRPNVTGDSKFEPSGPRLNVKTVFPRYGIPMFKIRRSWDRLNSLRPSDAYMRRWINHDWRQAIIWTNAEILLIGPLGTNFSEILIEIDIFSFKKMHLKMAFAKWRLFVSALMC